jgi:very-short-patch-repair endonuclease
LSLPYDKNKIVRAKELRRDSTYHEKKLWYQFLSKYKVRFQRQKVISGFIADFYCAQAFLIVEIDGNQHQTSQGSAYDRDRTIVLRQNNQKVIRFTNEDIETHFIDVCSEIDTIVHARLNEQLGSHKDTHASQNQYDNGTDSLPPSRRVVAPQGRKEWLCKKT